MRSQKHQRAASWGQQGFGVVCVVSEYVTSKFNAASEHSHAGLKREADIWGAWTGARTQTNRPSAMLPRHQPSRNLTRAAVSPCLQASWVGPFHSQDERTFLLILPAPMATPASCLSATWWTTWTGKWIGTWISLHVRSFSSFPPRWQRENQ